jgi:hypothetical protein
MRLNYDKRLAPCPICGSRASVGRSIVDGFDFGWDAGCPFFSLYDGRHGITEHMDFMFWPTVHGCNTKEDAILAWNEKAKMIDEYRSGAHGMLKR